ncbi:MAG: hypothetical protein M0C28_37000 [Candidatus Moduliflexus flocculans]|nr:hypothetical protein [Candidatus Moduliflexus flocculans]
MAPDGDPPLEQRPGVAARRPGLGDARGRARRRACARRPASPGTPRRGRFFVVGDRGALAEIEPSGAVVADAPGEGQPGRRDGPRPERVGSSSSRRRRGSSWSGTRPRRPRRRASPLDVAAILGQEPADRNQGFEGIVFRAEDGPARGRASSTSSTRGSPRVSSPWPSIPRGAPRTLGASDVVARHSLKPYDDLTAVAWSERLGRLLVIAESADRLLVVSPEGAIDADRAPAGRPAGGARPVARRRAVGRRREAGAAALSRRRRRPRDGARRRRRAAGTEAAR